MKGKRGFWSNAVIGGAVMRFSNCDHSCAAQHVLRHDQSTDKYDPDTAVICRHYELLALRTSRALEKPLRLLSLLV